MSEPHFRGRSATFLSLVLVLALFCAIAPAQTSRGSISGTILDQTGAVVANATVTAVKDDTGASRTTTTNSSGLFRMDGLDIGTYTVTVKAPTFSQNVNKGVSVGAARNTTLDISLTLGGSETVVTVEGSAEAVLEKTAQTRGGTFGEKTVQSLPLQGLDSLNVILLNPGAIAASTTSFSNGSNNYTINGARARTNNFMIDGVENNDISVAGPAYQITNQDAVQEVVVQTSNFSSEFGRAGGGVINQITKSGTNTLHGSATEIYQGHILDASDNGERLGCDVTDCRARYVENIPSFTIGGPVYIPKIYDGRNKTFFFAAAQWDRFFSSALATITIPTAEGLAQLQALNAACLAPGTNLATYLNILTTNGIVSPSVPFSEIPLFAPGNALAAAHPGYADLRLAVTTGGCGGDNRAGLGVRVGPYRRTAAQFFTDDNHQIRFDHTVSDKQTMSFRWLYDANEAGPFFTNLPGFDRGFNGITLTGQFTDTYQINSHWTNEFRFNYGRIGFDFPLVDPAVANGVPSFSMTGVTGFGGATNIPQFRFANNWQYQDTVSWVKGRHQFRFGVDFLRQLAKQHPPFNERGSISFVNSVVGGSTVNRGFANFIDDFAGGSSGAINRAFGSAGFQGIYYPNLFRQAYFVTDSWRMTPTFTLNLGLRYEDFGQPANIFFHPAFDFWSTTDFDQANSIDHDRNNFSPSVGFAWNPNVDSGPMHWLTGGDKMVIRGGFNMTYDNWFNNLLSNIAGSQPNTLGGSIASAASVVATPRGTANWFAGSFPTVTATPPTGASDQSSLFMPNIVNPYTYHYSFGVQRELPWKTILDVSYVGSAGRKLFQTYDMNPRGGYDLAGVILPRIHITDPICATASSTNRSRCARTVRGNFAGSSYNSLQLDLRKGYTSTPIGSLQFATAYTWSHSIDTISEVFGTDSTFSAFASQNLLLGGDPRADRASSDFDIRHRFVLQWVWELPSPKDNTLYQLFGGWGLAGVAQFQGGAPFTLRNGFDRDGDGQTGPDRPDFGNVNAPITSRAVAIAPGTLTLDPILGTVTFVCNTGWQDVDTSFCTTANDVHWLAGGFLLGLPNGTTVPRNYMRFPYTQRWDLSVTKAFRISERFRLQARAELLNAFNRQNFGTNSGGGNQPARTVGGSSGDGFLDLNQTEAVGRSLRLRLKVEF